MDDREKKKRCSLHWLAFAAGIATSATVIAFIRDHNEFGFAFGIFAILFLRKAWGVYQELNKISHTPSQIRAAERQ